MATNPNNSIGTNAAFGGRTSVNAFNDSLAVYSGKGILSGFYISPNSGMTVSIGGSGLVRDVAVAEDNVGNRTTINNISGSPITVTIPEAPASDSRYDTIVAYVVANPTGSRFIADNYGVCGLIVVSGEASSAPVLATDAQIRSAITTDSGTSGEKAYYVELGEVLVASGTATITADMITQNTTSILSGEKIIDGTLNGSAITDGTIDNDKIEDGTIDTAKLADGIITSGKLASGSVSAGKLLGFSTSNTTDSWVPVAHGSELQHRLIKPFNDDGSIPESAMGWHSYAYFGDEVKYYFSNTIDIFTGQGDDATKNISRWDFLASNYVTVGVSRVKGVGLIVSNINTSKALRVHGYIIAHVTSAGNYYVGAHGLHATNPCYYSSWGLRDGQWSTTSSSTSNVLGTDAISSVGTVGYAATGDYLTARGGDNITVRYDLLKTKTTGTSLWNFKWTTMLSGASGDSYRIECVGEVEGVNEVTIPAFFIADDGSTTDGLSSSINQLTLEYNTNQTS